MRKLIALGTAATTLGFVLACSGLPTGTHENVKACKAFVKQYNTLTCLPDGAKYDAADFCPEALDLTPKDMAPFYECMAKGAKCDGDRPDLAGMGDCKP